MSEHNRMTIEYSSDDGKTWGRRDIGSRSKVAYELGQIGRGETYSDGMGNCYRLPSS